MGQGLVAIEPSISLESGFDGELDAAFVEGSDAAIAFTDKEFLSVKGVELRQPELAVELFVQHVSIVSVGGGQTAFHYQGKPLAKLTGTKNPTSTRKGVKAG